MPPSVAYRRRPKMCVATLVPVLVDANVPVSGPTVTLVPAEMFVGKSNGKAC